MIPEDMMAALQGGGGAPPGGMPPELGGGGLPPDLLAALGAGGGAEPAPEPPAPRDTISILDEMIQLALEYIETDQDEEDKATMAKIHQTLQQYKADEQKETDNMLQGKFSPKGMRMAAKSAEPAY